MAFQWWGLRWWWHFSKIYFVSLNTLMYLWWVRLNHTYSCLLLVGPPTSASHGPRCSWTACTVCFYAPGWMWKQLHVRILYKNQGKDVKKCTNFTREWKQKRKLTWLTCPDLSEFKFCLDAQKKPCFYKWMQQKVIFLFVTLLCPPVKDLTKRYLFIQSIYMEPMKNRKVKVIFFSCAHNINII